MYDLRAGRGLNDDSGTHATWHPKEVGDGQRATGDAREERDPVFRSLVPAVAVLQGDAPSGMHRLRHLQPHVPPRLLRRSRHRVRAAVDRGDDVGRRGRTDRPGGGAGRRPAHRHAHVPRSLDVCREAGQVHDRDVPGRRHRERPGAAPCGREHLVDAAGRLGRRSLRDGGRGHLRPRRRRDLSRRASDAGTGAAVGEDAREARRARDLRHQVLLGRRVRDPTASPCSSAAPGGPRSPDSR